MKNHSEFMVKIKNKKNGKIFQLTQIDYTIRSLISSCINNTSRFVDMLLNLGI